MGTARRGHAAIAARVGVAALMAGGAVYLWVQADAVARIASGYKTKITCSEVFVAGRDPARVIAEDFADVHPAVARASVSVDRSAESVHGSVFGLGAAKAVYREGYGCTLLAKAAPARLPAATRAPDRPWPVVPAPPALDAAIDALMADAGAGHRALAVFVDGALVAERYAEGFGPQTPMQSWSMAKSVTASLVGAAVHRGYIDLASPPPVAEWKPGDRRADIAWRDLLQMQSGLAFSENYANPFADVQRMLFTAHDAGLMAAAKPLIHAPGTHWSYSSGTTNVLQRALRSALESAGVDYHRFAHEALFAPLGAASFVFETDGAGAFIGSSFAYATARDWARFGQLLLDDGIAGGMRILPEGWAAFMQTPATASDGYYGAQLWLNRDGGSGRARYFPSLPESAFIMSGHDGQYVVSIPETRTVLVRLGITRKGSPAAAADPVFGALYGALRDSAEGGAQDRSLND